VDWPPLFETLEAARLKPRDDPSPIDFTTPNPQVSSTLRWITIEAQDAAGLSSVQAHVAGEKLVVATTNVSMLLIRKPRSTIGSMSIDGQEFRKLQFPLLMVHGEADGSGAAAQSWFIAPFKMQDRWKNPARYGGFKQAFQGDMVFVVGSHSSDANRLWAAARYLSESLYYRGNGAVDVLTDSEYVHRMGRDRTLRNRNVILFGNADNNSAWTPLLRDCPITVSDGRISSFSEDGRAIASYAGRGGVALLTYPLPGSATRLVAAFGVTGSEAIDVIERLPVLPSGTAYPDWTILNARTEPSTGSLSVLAAGNFGNSWGLIGGQIATRTTLSTLRPRSTNAAGGGARPPLSP
jgi:hypothetical protein